MRYVTDLFASAHFVSCRTAGIRFASVGLPTFHLIGLATQVCYPLCSGRAAAVYTPQFPQRPLVPHPQSIYEVSKLTSCAVLTAPPAFIEVSSHQICDVQAFLTEGVKFWSKDPEAVKYLQSLRVLVSIFLVSSLLPYSEYRPFTGVRRRTTFPCGRKPTRCSRSSDRKRLRGHRVRQLSWVLGHYLQRTDSSRQSGLGMDTASGRQSALGASGRWLVRTGGSSKLCNLGFNI